MARQHNNASPVSRRNAVKLGAAALAGSVAASALGGTAAMADQTAPAPAAPLMQPGVYVGTAPGHKGLFDLPVTVTVDENSILALEVPADRFAHGETTPILNSVRDRMFPRVIASQSLEVDAITGATSSSLSAKNAIEDALCQAFGAAGVDGDALKEGLALFHRPVPKTEEGVVEEVSVDLLVVGLSIGGCFALKAATERMQELNGDALVSIMAIDRAGKFGGRSSLTHMMQSVNPSYAMEKFNDGKPFIDTDAYYQLWMDWITDEDGTLMADPDIIKMFFENSGETINWQVRNGWRLGSAAVDGCQDGIVSFHTMPAPMEQPGTFEDRRVLVDKFLNGFVSSCVAQGARVELETEGYEFLYDEATATVTGIKARNRATGKEYVIHAKAVLMGTGGFGANAEMLENLMPEPYNGRYLFLGTGTDTGLMVQAAINIGAGTRNIGMSPIVMHIGLPHFLRKYPINVDTTSLNQFTGRYSTWTLNDAPLGLGLSGNSLAVDNAGRRFADENQLMQLFSPSIHTSSWPSFRNGCNAFYSLWSKPMLDEVASDGLNHVGRWEVYQCQGGVPRAMPIPEIFEVLDACVEDGMAWKADTIEDLAAQIEIDPAVLRETVDAYNACCEAGSDEQYGKDPELLDPLAEGPFYAIELRNVIFATCGGLTVDAQVRVCLQDDKTPINGLYAFGCDSLGNLLNPKQNYTVFPAIAAGWNQTGGRMAALNAVDYINETYGLTQVSTQLLPADMTEQATDKPMW